ncbi:hypothetical protein DFH28DRAFT_23209 [Melampsora americana]|nr:hypothetical protein DFH28DRAFT_23209 [Melampsora americana]
MKQFLLCGLLFCSLLVISHKPPEVVKDATDFQTGVHSLLKEDLNSGQHNLQNTARIPHNTRRENEAVFSSGDRITYTRNPVDSYDIHPNNAEDIPSSDPSLPSPPVTNPPAKDHELPGYMKWESNPYYAIDLDTRFFGKYRFLSNWWKSIQAKCQSVASWFRRLFKRSPRRFSKTKPHKELFFSADTNLATDIVLDGHKIKDSAQDIRSNMIDELKSFLPNSKLRFQPDEVNKRLERFAKIEDITKWEEKSREESQSAKSLVKNIITSMQNEVKSRSESGMMAVNLQVMKCLSYVNANAGDYFFEHIFGALTNDEVERMWRALIDSEAEFRSIIVWRASIPNVRAETAAGGKETLYPGRYNSFLEQLHYKWIENNERQAHIQAFQEAIDKEEVPKELKSDIIQLKDAFSRLQMQTKWPVVDKGYYENSFSVIKKIKDTLRHSAMRYLIASNRKASETLQMVYRALNHIYRFDLQTKATSKWLTNTLEDSDVQLSLYLHVLSNEGLSHRNVAGMKLLKDFNLKASLDQSMKDYLTEERDIKFYSVLPDTIKKAPVVQSSDIRSSLPASFQSDKTLKDMTKIVLRVTEEDLERDEPDYRLSMKVLPELKRKGLLETKSPKEEKDMQRPHQKRISDAIHSVLGLLKDLCEKESTSKKLEQEKVLITVLNNLVSQNYFAWHLTRSELKGYWGEKLLKYLNSLKTKAEKAEDINESNSLGEELNFVSDMTQEIEEYKSRQTAALKLSSLLFWIEKDEVKNRKAAIGGWNKILNDNKRFSHKAGSSIPFSLQQYSDFIKRLSNTWFEIRWSRVKGGSYDANIVDLAEESLALIQSRAFAHMPEELDVEFISLLSDLAEKDHTGFLKKYYQAAVSDPTDYSTYQFFTKTLSLLAQVSHIYPRWSPEFKSVQFFKHLIHRD